MNKMVKCEIKQKSRRAKAMGAFLLVFFSISLLSGCTLSHQALKEQPPYISYEVEGDYRDLAECTRHLLDSQAVRFSKIREQRRPPRSIEVYDDWGNFYEVILASATFYDKGTNRTFIELRERDPWGDSLARRLEERFVKPCLRRTKE